MKINLPKCVSFDFDGTLVQSNAIKVEAYFEAGREVGASESLIRKVLAIESGDRTAICAAIVRTQKEEVGLPSERTEAAWVDFLVDIYSKWCEQSIANCPEVLGASASLAWLMEQGIPLYINSATLEEPLNRVLKLRGMNSYFKRALGAPADKVSNLLSILHHASASPCDMVFVGDNEVDRVAAHSVGCHFIGIENEFSEYTSTPLGVVKDLRQLPQKIVGLYAPGGDDQRMK